MLPQRVARPVKKQYTYHAILFISALFLGAALLVTSLRHPQPSFSQGTAQANSTVSAFSADQPVLLPPSIQQGLPAGWELHSVTPASDGLWAGKLLLIDEEHAVPEPAPAPNTLSIAALGKGKIAVRSMRPSTNEETIQALMQLFEFGKMNSVSDWLVWEGSRSYGQQLDMQLERLRQYAQSMPLVQAAQQAMDEVPGPGHSEHQLPWVVDIRLAKGWNVLPDTAPLSASPDGRLLVDNAWKFGFIHRYGNKIAPPYEDEAYHFRYIGAAHSTIMHELSLDLPAYLALLHKEGTLTYYEDGLPRFAALCMEAADEVSFKIPAGCTWEASMDNTGYAILAVTFPKDTDE